MTSSFPFGIFFSPQCCGEPRFIPSGCVGKQRPILRQEPTSFWIQAGNVDNLVFGLNGCPTIPERLEVGQAANLRHHVEPNTFGLDVLAPGVDGMSRLQETLLEGRDSDRFRLQLLDRRLESAEIGVVGERDNVGVAAKLRDRARGQANLLVRGTSATASPIPRAARPGSARTNLPTHHRQDRGCQPSVRYTSPRETALEVLGDTFCGAASSRGGGEAAWTDADHYF